jgi:hypothetical protein
MGTVPIGFTTENNAPKRIRKTSIVFFAKVNALMDIKGKNALKIRFIC